MLLKNNLPLDGNYVGFFANFEDDMEIEERGVVLLIIDLQRENNTSNINVLPCKIIHVPDYHYAWIIKNSNIVVKVFDFTN